MYILKKKKKEISLHFLCGVSNQMVNLEYPFNAAYQLFDNF